MILFQPETNLSEKDSLRLREEGQNLADSLQCPFLDEDWDEIKEGAVIEDSLRALVESIKQRSSGMLSIAPPLADTNASPDLRVIMCLHCGDPFNIEAVLGPLLGHSSCHQSGKGCPKNYHMSNNFPTTFYYFLVHPVAVSALSDPLVFLIETLALTTVCYIKEAEKSHKIFLSKQ